MAALEWDKVGEHFYQTGDDRAVVYPYNSNSKAYDAGYAWSGITGVTESPSGAEETALYADNIKYLSLRSAEEYSQTVTAYAYPEAFAELDGTKKTNGVRIYQQARKSFGMSYRSIIGNDTDGNDAGYRLHLVYGLTASPSERAYSTVNDSPEAIEFSWEMTGIPVSVKNAKPTCLITVDSTDLEDGVENANWKWLEEQLYGTDASADTYEATTPTTTNPKTEGLYERTGTGTTEDPYVYELTDDETVDAGKTYYKKVTHAGTTARLPLPDEIIEHFGVTVGG